MTMEMSACCATAVVAEEVLFVGVGSLTSEEIVAVFVTVRSATSVPVSDVVAVEVLLVGFRSAVELLTVAVFEIVVPAKLAGTLYVDVIVTLCDGFSVPSAHGYGPLHAPLFETKVRPAGVGSLTWTFAAGEGPRFETVIV